VVTLLNRKSERGDSGIYKLVLKNTEGVNQIQFRVNVLSPPTKPEGPLEAANVTAEGCTLNWKPPVNLMNSFQHFFCFILLERRWRK
jgi:hypothetical protein